MRIPPPHPPHLGVVAEVHNAFDDVDGMFFLVDVLGIDVPKKRFSEFHAVILPHFSLFSKTNSPVVLFDRGHDLGGGVGHEGREVGGNHASPIRIVIAKTDMDDGVAESRPREFDPHFPDTDAIHILFIAQLLDIKTR